MIPPRSSSASGSAGAQRASAAAAGSFVLPETALSRDARAGLDAAERLRGYHQFLQRARSAKATAQAPNADLERAVLAQARQALDDAGTLARGALRAVRNLRDGGALDALTGGFARFLEESGPAQVSDLWERAAASEEARAVLRRAGLSAPMYAQLDATMRAVDARLSADGDRIVVAGVLGGAAAQAAMRTTPRPAAPSGVRELLCGGRFDALADAFERGEAAYLTGLALPDDEPRSDEVALGGVLASYQEMVRHVRKLEDIGLDTQRGASVDAVLLIALVAGIAAAIATVILCPARDPDINFNDPIACTISKILLNLSLAVVLIALGIEAKQAGAAVVVQTGSVVVHGVVRDFGTPAQSA